MADEEEKASGYLYVQTDKRDHKDIPCQTEGCLNGVRVNKFYAPVKAKCPQCGGAPADEVLAWTGMDPTTSTHNAPPPPVIEEKALSTFCCPFCGFPLQVLAVAESMGHLVFGCSGDDMTSATGKCDMVIEVRANWRALQVRSVPDGWGDVVKKMREVQKRVILEAGF